MKMNKKILLAQMKMRELYMYKYRAKMELAIADNQLEIAKNSFIVLENHLNLYKELNEKYIEALSNEQD